LVIVRGESTIMDYHAPFDQGFSRNVRISSDPVVRISRNLVRDFLEDGFFFTVFYRNVA